MKHVGVNKKCKSPTREDKNVFTFFIKIKLTKNSQQKQKTQWQQQLNITENSKNATIA